jgi:hypothetical protein
LLTTAARNISCIGSPNCHASAHHVLDADQPGVGAVTVEQHALAEVLVHDLAEMMRLHLVGEAAVREVESVEIDVGPHERPFALQQRGSGWGWTSLHSVVLQ